MKDFLICLLMGLGATVIWDAVQPYAKQLAVRVRCWWLLRNLK